MSSVFKRSASIASSYSAALPQITPPVLCHSTSELLARALQLELVSDPKYCSRYRDPLVHDQQHLRSLAAATSCLKFASRSKQPGPATAFKLASTSIPVSSSSVSHLDLHSTSAGVFEASSRSVRTEKDTRPLALLFPGSGSQYVGMGKFLVDNYQSARETWEEAEDILGNFEAWRAGLDLPQAAELEQLNLLSWPAWNKDRSPNQLRKIVFGGAPQQLLTKTSNAQPAILITSIAFLRVLEREMGLPVATKWARYFIGHSAGEWAASFAAGALSFEDAVRITRLAGLLTSRTLMTSGMEAYSSDADPEIKAQMTAVLLRPGHNQEEIESIVQKIWEEFDGEGEGRVEVGAYNSSTQIVLSGSQAGVHRVCDELRDKGIAQAATDIPVWVPFHSTFMRPAEAGVRLAISRGVKVKQPLKPIVSCLDGEIVDTKEGVVNTLVSQMSKPVRWTQALYKLRSLYGVTEYMFLGPGKALANLAKREVERGNWNNPVNSSSTPRYQINSVATDDEIRKLRKQFKS